MQAESNEDGSERDDCHEDLFGEGSVGEEAGLSSDVSGQVYKSKGSKPDVAMWSTACP